MCSVHSTSQSEIEHSSRLFNRNVARPGSPVLFWINGRSVGNFGESPLQYWIVAMISLSVLNHRKKNGHEKGHNKTAHQRGHQKGRGKKGKKYREDSVNPYAVKLTTMLRL